MNPTVVCMAVCACLLGGVLVGGWLRTVVPERHLNAESRDIVKVGVGLIATMTALVLGLITASTKSSFDAADRSVKNAAMDILTLDRLLARYGHETAEIRDALQRTLAQRIDSIWPKSSSHPPAPDPSANPSEVEELVDAIRRLTPLDASRRTLQSRALDLGESLLQARWLVSAGGGTSVPVPFLVVLTSWLTITFASFGLLAPRNATVLSILFICALSVSAALFLVLEMDGPFDGLLRVSASPLLYAYAHLNQ